MIIDFWKVVFINLILMNIVMDLSNLDVSLDDEDISIKLLYFLPKDYKHFRETVLYGKDVITLEEVKGAFLQRELIEKQLTKSDDLTEGGKGLILRRRSRGNFGEDKPNRDKSRSISRHKNVVCYNCKKKNNIKKFCPEKGKNKGKWNRNGSISYDLAAIVHSSDEESFCDDSPILLAVESGTRSRDQWTLDSGCSYHITPNRRWLLLMRLLVWCLWGIMLLVR